jgi:hypothetical protein
LIIRQRELAGFDLGTIKSFMLALRRSASVPIIDTSHSFAPKEFGPIEAGRSQVCTKNCRCFVISNYPQRHFQLMGLYLQRGLKELDPTLLQ